MSKKPPKPHMMANYYEKVALVFFKAENKLFHAAALLKLFTLIKDQKKTVTPEELKRFVKFNLIRPRLFLTWYRSVGQYGPNLLYPKRLIVRT